MRLKALIIDDSAVMRRMVRMALSDAGLGEFDFVDAEDGDQALKTFFDGGFDIVFCDWNMPKVSGIEFLNRVRKQPKYAGTPIVMVTSEVLLGKIAEATADGADAYIRKPFTAESFNKELSGIVEKARSRKKPSGFFGKLLGR